MFQNTFVVVDFFFLSQVNFLFFSMFLGMVMYANEVKSKEK